MINGVIATEGAQSAAYGGGLTLSAEQWEDAGVSRKKLRLLVASGDLVRVRHGCYITRETAAEAKGEPRLAHAVKASAVCAGTTCTSVASHHSAARMHGIEMLHPPGEDIVTITVPPGDRTGRHRGADVTRQAARLPAGHVTKFRGVPVTTVARTVVDIARASTFMQGVVVADSALRKQLTLTAEMMAVLRDCEGWPGVRVARRVAEFADWAAESVLESCARVVFHEQGLPEPVLQVPLLGSDGRFAARVDFCWPEFGTVAEADGMAKYQTRGGFKEHHKRDERIRDVGWEAVHFSWDELFADPGGIAGRIRFCFDRGLDPTAKKRRESVRQPALATRRTGWL